MAKTELRQYHDELPHCSSLEMRRSLRNHSVIVAGFLHAKAIVPTSDVDLENINRHPQSTPFLPTMVNQDYWKFTVSYRKSRASYRKSIT